MIFNFMFDFINRAASIKDAIVVSGLDELIPYGDWRARLEQAEQTGATPDQRKSILVASFTDTLRTIGAYAYVAETTILRPLRDSRSIACATRRVIPPKSRYSVTARSRRWKSNRRCAPPRRCATRKP